MNKIYCKKNFRLLCLIILSLSFHNLAFSQHAALDSLTTIIESNASELTILQTFEYMNENALVPSEKRSVYEQKVFRIVNKNLRKKSLTASQRNYLLSFAAVPYLNRFSELFDDNPGKSIFYADKMIAIYRKTGRQNLLASMLVTKGICHNRIEEHKKAISCLYEGLKIFEKERDQLGIVYASSAIAGIHIEQLNFKAAIPNLTRGIQYYGSVKNLNPSDQVQYSSLCYNLGNAYQYLKELDSAKMYLNKGLALSMEPEQPQIAGPILRVLGTVHFTLREYGESLSFYKRSLALGQNKYMNAYTYSFMAASYVAVNDYPKAIFSAKKAIADGKGGPKSSTILSNAYTILHEAYLKSGNYAQALNAYKNAVAYRDSMGRAQSQKELRDKSLTYEFEKKALLAKLNGERKLRRIKAANRDAINQRNSIIYFALAAALFLLAGILFLYYYSKQKNLIEASRNNELKQRLLLTQMTPHFIFNSVSNIQGLIVNKKDKEAISYLGKFSKLTRQILENSRENFVVFSEELTMLENYLAIQKMLYNNKFSYEITVGAEIDPDGILVPPMLTQPFVENAIIHGLKNKVVDGVIKLKYYIEKERLYFEVSDNGSGLENSIGEGHHSLATQITEERLASIIHKSGIAINTINVEENDLIIGVKTYFEIPFKPN